jgi:hypothetical protein
VLLLPLADQANGRLHLLQVLRGVVVDREHQQRVSDLRQHAGELRVAVQEEAVGDQPDLGLRPGLPREGDELRKLRVDRGLASQQHELVRIQALLPAVEPLPGLLQGDDALVPVVGVVRAEVAREIARVGNVKLKIEDVGQHGTSPG